MTSEYMNNLYRDLLSNSPQTVTIPIPSDMGTGQIAQVVTKQGAVVSDWKMNYFSDMNVRGINSEDYIQMLFCLNDGVSWNIAGSREGACLAKGESCMHRTDRIHIGRNNICDRTKSVVSKCFHSKSAFFTIDLFYRNISKHV